MIPRWCVREDLVGGIHSPVIPRPKKTGSIGHGKQPIRPGYDVLELGPRRRGTPRHINRIFVTRDAREGHANVPVPESKVGPATRSESHRRCRSRSHSPSRLPSRRSRRYGIGVAVRTRVACRRRVFHVRGFQGRRAMRGGAGAVTVSVSLSASVAPAEEFGEDVGGGRVLGGGQRLERGRPGHDWDRPSRAEIRGCPRNWRRWLLTVTLPLALPKLTVIWLLLGPVAPAVMEPPLGTPQA